MSTAPLLAPGALLVAAPPLHEPNFVRTVVLLLEHGDGGSLGVVLNRKTTKDLAELTPPWAQYGAPPRVLYLGGPVQPDGVLVLGRVSLRAPGTSTEGFAPILGSLGILDLDLDPAQMGVEVEALRAFAGYAGWGPGQLDEEIADAGWFVVAAEPGDVFDDDPHTMWRRVLRRQTGRLRMFANCPLDPSTN